MVVSLGVPIFRVFTVLFAFLDEETLLKFPKVLKYWGT